MRAYAQTNIQLYRQLAERGYVEAEIDTLARAYELSMRLLSGTFPGWGKPFLSHLVGTASILGSLRARASVVAAGLLHASYSHGEFGNGWRGMFPARRMEIRRAIGQEIENLVAQYTEFPWHAGTIGEIRGRMESLTATERDVLLIHLANELEDHLDLGIIYLGDAERRREYMRTHLTFCVDMAERLGFPELAAALAATFADLEKAEVPVSLRRAEDASFLVPPASHRTRFRIVASHLIARVRQGRPR